MATTQQDTEGSDLPQRALEDGPVRHGLDLPERVCDEELFDARLTVLGDTALLVLDGEVDIHTVDRLEGCVTRAIASGALHLVVDAGHVSFVDAGGARVLV